MNRIIAPLRPGDEGQAVADLQEALQQVLRRDAIPVDEQTRAVLLESLRPEIAERSFGDVTTELVNRFQEHHQLDTTGEVDERTARAMNGLLARWGLLDGTAIASTQVPDTSFTLEVTVLDGRQAPIAGLTVGATNTAERAPSAGLGEPAVTGADGSALLRFSRSAFVTGDDPDGHALALGFAVSRQDVPLVAEVVSGGMTPTDNGVGFAPAVLVVAAHAVVTGQVTYDGVLPAEQLDVQIRNLRFGGDHDLLGHATTDPTGSFTLAYDPGAGAVNLEAVTSAGVVPLGPVAYAAGLVHSFTLIAPPAPLQPEYTRLSADLAAQIGDLGRLAQAKESAERQDLTMLSRTTGWDPRLIALAATSERLAAADNQLSLDSQTLYGMLRAGLPSDVATLARMDGPTVAKALTRARDNGVLDLDDGAIAEVTGKFQDFTVSARLQMTAPGSQSTYAELLDGSGIGQAERAGFAKLIFDHRGDPTQLWSAAGDLGITEDQIGRLKLQGKFAHLAGNSAPLTAHLLSLDVSDPAALIEQGFFAADRWKQELTTVTGGDDAALAALIPASYESDVLAERVDAYTGDLARKLRISYPTDVVTQLVAQGDLAVEAPAATVTLLKAATADGFVLGQTPAQAFFAAKGGGAVGLDDAEFAVAKQDIKNLHRTYQLSPGNEAMTVLTTLGLTSAYDIAGMGAKEFTRAFDEAYLEIWKVKPAAAVTKLVYRKAQQISSVTYTVFGAAQTLKAQPGLPVTAPSVAVKQAAQTSLLKHFPTMEGLFGSIDYIECPHCRSVLSPAAYFVDILQCIDPDEPKWVNFLAGWKSRHGGKDYTDRYAKPIDVLQERRPDLFAMELTCENTLTALPYIDVVNEILEYYVAHGKLTEDAAHDTGAATTEELLAEPQNLLRLAYTELLGKRYPGPLPFDLWIETVREFSTDLGTPLHEVMEAFRDSDALIEEAQAYDRADTFVEYLGFSPAEAAILTDSDPLAEWWLLYGYPDAAEATTEAVDAQTGQRVDLNSAKSLARRLQITYQELVDIIQTGFVNPELPKLGLLYKLGASIRDARHYTEHRADPAPLTPEQVASKQQVDAFEARLAALAALAGVPLATLQDEVDTLPYPKVLVLADPNTGADFDLTTLRYADGTPADPLTFVRLAHFVRLWRKLGWSIEETDRALHAFVPPDAPFAEPTLSLRPMRSALIYLSHLAALTERLELNASLRRRLATLWLDLPTTGPNSLYAQLFLTRSLLRSDPIFDHALGRYLDWSALDPAEVPSLRDHLHSVQAALGLSRSDVDLILVDAKIDPAGPVDLPTLSTLHRYALLATMLRTGVSELITLKSISGMDPFAALHPGALENLEQDHPYGQTLRFVELAQRIAASGLTGADLDELLRGEDRGDGRVPDLVLQQVKALADGARAIRAAHAVPADPGSLSDEQLRQALGLVLDRDVVDKLLAIVQSAAEFAVATPEVRAAAKEFFAKYLRKEAIDAGTSFGFLQDADFEQLIAPLPPIPAGLTPDEELAAHRAADEAVRAKRAILSMAFLPFLQRRLIRQLAVETITAQAGAEPAMVEDLLTDGRLLGAPEPLLAAFEHVDDTIDAEAAGFEGWLEVPANGVYRFTSVVGQQSGQVELRFDHLAQPVVLSGTAAAAQDEFGGTVELQAGRMYAFTYATTDLNGGTAHLDVQSAVLARGSVAQLRLYPRGVVTRAGAALALIGKILRLARALDLSQAEVRHLATHPDAFGGLELGDLPTSRVGDGPDELTATVARFRWLSRLIDYAAVKRELGGGDELLTVLQANESTDPDRLATKVYPIVAGLVGQSVGTVAGTATTIWPSNPTFDSDQPLRRLLDGLRIVRALGVPADAVTGWTGVIRETDQQVRFDIATEVKDAIRATLEPAAWQRIAQPIFDRLRARQRDALVAYVQHAVGVSSMEQLYEYFLIDPGMEPVVQTSRIRVATASVQQFIHRILLNLEPTVPPETVNAGQWEWMCRYRLWEVNRKIFLYPENWLEPEFRDQKTHLFTELESTLLEGDVSSDLVEDAFLTYLTKLDQLARLDIVATHLEDYLDPALRTLHVFGRTFGIPRAYFYRRYASGGWTPWEPVGLDIQGDHVVPVVWHDRLWLFWVTFRTIVEESTTTTTAGESITIPPPSKTLIAQLHWSEHVQGAWGNPSSSNAELRATHTAPGRVAISVAKESFTEDGEERGVYISLGWPFNQAFYVQGRNSPPVSAAKQAKGYAYSPSAVNSDGTRRTVSSGPLTVSIQRRVSEIGLDVTTKTENATVLTPVGSYSVLEPNNDLTSAPAAIGGLISPIFVQDGQYTLFGEPTMSERTVQEWEEWVTVPAPRSDVFRFEDHLDRITITPARPDLGSLVLHDDLTGSVRKRPPVGGEHPDWLLNDVTGLAFDDVIIHPATSTQLIGLHNARAIDSRVLGSDVAAGATLIPRVVDQTLLAATEPIGLGVVGGAGASRAIFANTTAFRQLERAAFTVADR